MLNFKMFTLIVVFVMCSLITVNEVHAAPNPEPCKELFDILIRPDKPKKIVEEKHETKEKNKAKSKQLHRIEKALEKAMQWKADKDSEELEIKKPEGILEGMLTGYMNFLSYLMKF